MKSEQEIRDHRDSLQFAREKPCDCRGTEHEAKCYMGQMMMYSTIETLSWILGENEAMNGLVECFAENARKINYELPNLDV